MKSFEPTRYESGRPMLLGGLRRQHPFSESGRGLLDQWRQFQALGRIPGQVGTNVYGVMCGHNSDGFEYMCAVEVESFTGLPDSLGRMRIQSQEYAVFEHREPVSTIRTTWDRIFEWLSIAAEYQSAHKPDFEVYDETFDLLTGLGGAEIWISIARMPGYLLHPELSLKGDAAMKITGSANLLFDPKLQPNKKKKLRDGLSASTQAGNTLWVANDETISLERLSLDGSDGDGNHSYSNHASFELDKLLELPKRPQPPEDIEEADVEGMDFKDGYLWLVGSHSLKRKKVEQGDPVAKSFKRLANVSADGNRFLLARIPLVKEGETYTLKKEVQQEDGAKKTAAQLQGDRASSQLTKALLEDDHLQRFPLIPGKDNGLDIEGLAVSGNRVFIGLRGPVLRGWAIILELELEVDVNEPSKLNLKSINPNNLHNPNNPTYRKHFLQLGGLGVRDLCVRDSDLLILTGPTMDLDGPVKVFRWIGGAKPESESVVFEDELVNVGCIPYGTGEERGKDHAESITLFSPDGGRPGSVLVTYDSPTKRRKLGEDGVTADIFDLSSEVEQPNPNR